MKLSSAYELMGVPSFEILAVFIAKIKSLSTCLHDDCKDGQASNLPRH